MSNMWLVWEWFKIAGAPNVDGLRLKITTQVMYQSYTQLELSREYHMLKKYVNVICPYKSPYEGFHQLGYPKIDGVQWKMLFKWMTRGYSDTPISSIYSTLPSMVCSKLNLQPPQGISTPPASGTWHGPSQHSLPSRRKPWETPRRWPRRWPFLGDSTRGSSRSQR